MMAGTPKDFFELATKVGAELVDLKFVDMLGTWQHCSYPIDTWDEKTFTEGMGFDGSSIRGWQAINASDMLAIPDASTVRVDPFWEKPTLSVIANVVDPITRQEYTRDPRYVARKGVAYLKQTGIADTVFIGPEPEFFIFDDVRYKSAPNGQFYEVDSSEGAWNSAKSEGGLLGQKVANIGSKIPMKGGYFPVSPLDTLGDIRAEMVAEMRKVGIVVEAHHHEVATAGQCEIDMKFMDLLSMGDQMMWFKYIIRNVARKHGKSATFMPKPIFQDNGSGMHTHFSLWNKGQPLFAGNGYAGMSEMALYAIGGVLKHARAILAFAAPTTNSYKRLVPGYEAPVNLAMSQRNRSASVRIPMYSANPKAKRFEFRCPDPSSNPYLTFSAVLMAALDGITNKIDPGEPLERDIYEMSPEELAQTRKTPGSLEEALEALEADHEFLTRGDVFTQDLIEAWISWKREKEIDPMRLRPHPYEFALYYDN
ncbi:MAG: type I glutamate--ammonia ligase [Planctomycetota bacterium]|nr:type I glutamate--ammonia ligase [Planctomycetota bacterium]